MPNGINDKQHTVLCLVIQSLQAGGMERVMSELAEYFASKNNIELHMVLYGITRELFYPVPVKMIIHKPDFEFNQNRRVFSTLRTLFFLRKRIIKINPISILSFGEYWNSFVLLALFGLKYPVYISDRCSPEKKFSIFHSFLRKALYTRAKGIIAQTGTAKENYQKQFKHRNIRVIGNPIREISRFNETAKENIVLMVGRLIKSKNQDKLIELFLNIQVPGWKLFLVGYDHLKQNNFEGLQSIITQKGAEQRVILAGKQVDVDSYYLRSKIFAFTSSSEGFPNSIGEAMSAGLPVVAFDCVAGPSDMINDNSNGFLIPLFDYPKFQEKLEMLMKDEDLNTRLGKNAFKDIKQFSIQQIGEQYLLFVLNKN